MPRGPKGEKRPTDVIGNAVKVTLTRMPNPFCRLSKYVFCPFAGGFSFCNWRSVSRILVALFTGEVASFQCVVMRNI